MTEQNINNLINPNWAQHGYIQVYTGNGKGKTTASLGLAMRALGRNWKVLIIMFTKGGNDYGELNSFRELAPEIKNKLKIDQAGLDRIVYKNNQNADDKREIKKGWEFAKEKIKNNEFQLIILDEINIAIFDDKYQNKSCLGNAMDFQEISFDLVYLDPPYCFRFSDS